MDPGDVQFRIGLIIAVIVLGSAFAGGLYLLIGENDEGDAKRTADTLGRALSALSPGSSGASLTIEFRSGSGEGIRIDPQLGGEHYTIHVLRSLIYIDWKEGREVVAEIQGILPSYTPFVQEGSAIPVQGLGSVCSGFSIRTPCTLIADLTVMNGSSYILVHPPDKGWTQNASAFAEFLQDDAFPAPGKTTKASLTLEAPSLLKDRWLLVSKEEGSCPYPIWIPLRFQILLPDQVPEGLITAEVRSRIATDGDITIEHIIR